MKSLFFVTFLFFSNYSAFALRCYSCTADTHGVACYDPLGNNVKALECRITASMRLTSNETQMEITNDTGIVHNIHPRDVSLETYSEVDSYSNYHCVQYELRSYLGRRSYVRKCVARNNQENFCTSLRRGGIYNGYSVTTCNVCYSDYCNSSKNVKLSLALNAIFFVVFYYATDSGK